MSNSDRELVLHAGNSTRRGGVTRKVIRATPSLGEPPWSESIGYEAQSLDLIGEIEPEPMLRTRSGERGFKSLSELISNQVYKYVLTC